MLGLRGLQNIADNVLVFLAKTKNTNLDDIAICHSQRHRLIYEFFEIIDFHAYSSHRFQSSHELGGYSKGDRVEVPRSWMAQHAKIKMQLRSRLASRNSLRSSRKTNDFSQ
jgi:hypothetical protein